MITQGDCVEVMRAMKPNSIDAIVTDPPYGLEFMGKEWDKDLLHEKWLTEAFRVLKPGASMLVMGGTRTFHRLACAIEDTGFIIKDTLMWIYGSGFPKAQDLGKMIDKRAGKEKIVGKGWVGTGKTALGQSSGWNKTYNPHEFNITEPNTPLAKHWNGFKIGGIKPAYEPIIWAAKPPDGSYIDNVLKWGVGAVNVDECRIPSNGDENFKRPALGRFPANIILDEQAGAMLDEQSGDRPGDRMGREPRHNRQSISSGKGIYGKYQDKDTEGFNDSGGASRFFYCAKASRGERNAGLEGMEERIAHDDVRMNTGGELPQQTPNKHTPQGNNHPTVKPIALMSWLIKLVTRKGQVVLDPFLGSGTTGISAKQAGREFIGIEQEVEYIEIAEGRIAHHEQRPQQMELEAAEDQ